MAVLFWVGLVSTAEQSAAYQNYLITIEMFLAAILLRFAFPYRLYRELRKDDKGRGIPMQKISSHFKDTLNPHDVVNDAIHNFSRVYQQYAQQGDLSEEENIDRSRSSRSDTSSLDTEQSMSNGMKSQSSIMGMGRKRARLDKEPEREVLLVESDEDEIL